MPASETSRNNSELSRRRRALHCGCSAVLMQRTHALCSTGCTSLLPPPVHVPAGVVSACRSMKSGAATDGCAVKRLKIIMIVIVSVVVIVIVIEIEIVMMMLMMLTTTMMTKMTVVAVMVVVGLGGGGCKREESARGETQTRRRDMHLERPCSQCPVQGHVRVAVWVQASCTCHAAFGSGLPIKSARHEHTRSHHRTNNQPPNLQPHTTTCGTCA